MSSDRTSHHHHRPACIKRVRPCFDLGGVERKRAAWRRPCDIPAAAGGGLQAVRPAFQTQVHDLKQSPVLDRCLSHHLAKPREIVSAHVREVALGERVGSGEWLLLWDSAPGRTAASNAQISANAPRAPLNKRVTAASRCSAAARRTEPPAPRADRPSRTVRRKRLSIFQREAAMRARRVLHFCILRFRKFAVFF